jgi:hypothetical protein
MATLFQDAYDARLARQNVTLEFPVQPDLAEKIRLRLAVLSPGMSPGNELVACREHFS